MALFRRFGRPGLLGGVTRGSVIAGTPTMTARAIGRGRYNAAVAEAEVAAYHAQPGRAAAPHLEESISSQLSTLSSLRQSGEISDDEYVRIKTQVLGSLTPRG